MAATEMPMVYRYYEKSRTSAADGTSFRGCLSDGDDIFSKSIENQGGAMSFTLKRAELTSATPEIGGPESVTLTLEGQSTGNAVQSSIVIQRIAYA